MPNFVTKEVKDLNFPIEIDGVLFEKEAFGRNLNLISTCVDNERFFIVKKPKNNKFIIKIDKITRPSRIELAQKALEVFEKNFCSGTVSKSFVFKKKPKENSQFIALDSTVHEILSNSKFDKIFIEIGFGSGRHLIFQAKNNPKVLILGVEIYKNAIEQVANLARINGLNNVFLVNSDARVLIDTIDSGKIDKIFLHFPVPWDDSPHRRVVSNDFINQIHRVLKNGAEFELRTDSKDYLQFCIENILSLKRCDFFVNKNKTTEVISKYEDRWLRQNKDIFDLIMVNLNTQDGLNVNRDFKFTIAKFNFEQFYNSFKNTTLKFDDFFVHFEEIYKVCDNEFILKVSFGVFYKPQTMYISLLNDGVFYFNNMLPLNTDKNFKSHKIIEKELLKWQI